MSKKIGLLVLVASIFAMTLGQNVQQYPPQPPPAPTPQPNTTTTTPPTTTPPTTTPPTTTTPKTTTTSATTTTTPPPDTTTTPQPHTTTNTPPTTTSVAPPITTPAPPAPKPDVGSWKVVDPKTNFTCIIADMAIQLNVSYMMADNKTGHAIILVPVNGTTAAGNCGNDTQTVTLTWHSAGVTLANMNNSIQLTFSKNVTTKIAEVDRIDVVIQANTTEFIGIANFTTMKLVNNQSEFSTSVGMSYLCSKVQTLNLTKDGTVAPIAVIEVSHLRVESFREKKDDKFSAAKDCEPSSTTDYIPIGVGCGLVALVAIVLVAYLIGRRRTQARGYLSM